MIEHVRFRILLVALSGWVNRHQLEVIAYLRDGRPAAPLDRRLVARGVAPHRGLTGYGVGHAVARASRDAGLDRVRPHQLRYFAATAMQAAGAC